MALSDTTEDFSGNKSLKLSHKQWKKLKRKQKRQALAKQRKENERNDDNKGIDTDEEQRMRQAIEEENARQHQKWELRDHQAHQRWIQLREHEERERQKKEETERKIREEWEERERKEQDEKEKKEKEQAERKEKQDTLLKQATQNEHKEWHMPLAPVNYNRAINGIVREVDKCPFFTKTGACRFGDRCSRAHLRPDSSTILMIAGMFQSFELKKSSVDDYDTDMNLEYEDSDLYSAFREFYDDVVPEFKSVGRVVNVKVCCNHEPHLRGNVYVQYKRESEAHDAFIKFNARWYGGRQMTCEFVNISKWKSAICGLFFAKRCPKGRNCNFLHVFRNPGNEFWEADRDFETPSRHKRFDDTPIWHPRSERRRSHHRRRSRSRSHSRSWSRTVDSSRSHSNRHRSTRDRSRSRSPVSRSRSRRKSKERSPPSPDTTSRKRHSTSPPQQERAQSTSRDAASKTGRSSKSKRKRSRHSRSRSASKDRSKEGESSFAFSSTTKHSQTQSKDCPLSPQTHRRSWSKDSPSSRKHSHSESSSAESRSEDDSRKDKKHKAKKSKKSGKSKKKKKKKEKVSQGPVSLPHLDDDSDDKGSVGLTRSDEVEEKRVTNHSRSDDTELEKARLIENGVYRT